MLWHTVESIPYLSGEEMTIVNLSGNFVPCFKENMNASEPSEHSPSKGGSCGNKILYKNLDLTQDFSNKISFYFLYLKKMPKNLPKIFR